MSGLEAKLQGMLASACQRSVRVSATDQNQVLRDAVRVYRVFGPFFPETPPDKFQGICSREKLSSSVRSDSKHSKQSERRRSWPNVPSGLQLTQRVSTTQEKDLGQHMKGYITMH